MIWETLFPANHLTGPKTVINHLAVTSEPNLTTNKLQHKTINTYKTKPNECRTWFRNLLHHWTTKWNGPILQLPGRAQKYLN